jgi:hypothetical protein
MQDADHARLAREKRCPTIVPQVVISLADGPSVTRDSIRSASVSLTLRTFAAGRHSWRVRINYAMLRRIWV